MKYQNTTKQKGRLVFIDQPHQTHQTDQMDIAAYLNRKDTEGESSVNKVYNNKHITLNTKHITHNTTFAGQKPAEKEVLIETSSSPLASASQNNDLAILEKEVEDARRLREAIHAKKHKDFKEDKDQKRQRMQFAKERDAKYMIANSSDIYRIEATVHSKNNKINIDVLQNTGERFQKYAANLQASRARDLTQNIAPKYKDWYGYDIAKEAMKDGACIGKMRLRQTVGPVSRIAPKVLPKTAVILHGRDLTVIIGDSQYHLHIEDFDRSEYFVGKGIFVNENMLEL